MDAEQFSYVPVSATEKGQSEFLVKSHSQVNFHMFIAKQHIVNTCYEKKTIINHGLQIRVIKATRWRIACADLVIISTYFYINLN